MLRCSSPRVTFCTLHWRTLVPAVFAVMLPASGANLLAKRPLTFAEAPVSRPVLISDCQGCATPSVAEGVVVGAVQLDARLAGPENGPAVLIPSATCTEVNTAALVTLAFGAIPVWAGATQDGTVLNVPVELPWNGLPPSWSWSHPDAQEHRSYVCTLTVELRPAERLPPVAKATSGGFEWEVLVTDAQAQSASPEATPAPLAFDATNPDTGEAVAMTVEIPPGTTQSWVDDTGVEITSSNVSIVMRPSDFMWVGAYAELPGGPIVNLGEDGVETTFASEDPSWKGVLLGLEPSGPFANAEGLVPSFFDPALNRWVQCSEASPEDCQLLDPVEEAELCPEGQRCAWIRHFSQWTLLDTGLYLRMTWSLPNTTPWYCATTGEGGTTDSGRCPSTWINKTIPMHSVPALESGGTLTATLTVSACNTSGTSNEDCVPPTHSEALSAPTLSWTGLPGAAVNPTVVSDPGTFTDGIATMTLSGFVKSGKSTAKATLSACALLRAFYGATTYTTTDDTSTARDMNVFKTTGTPCTDTTTLPLEDSDCPDVPEKGLSQVNSYNLVPTCLNMEVVPRVDSAVLSSTLSLSTAQSYASGSNLAANTIGSLNAFWAVESECDDGGAAWNPWTGDVNASGTSTSPSSASLSISTAKPSDHPYVRVGATLTNGDHVLGPCVRVESDADGDGYGAVQDGGPDCDDTSSAIHPGASDSTSTPGDEDCGGANGPQPSVGLPGSTYTSLQAALNAAGTDTTVWVGAGTYSTGSAGLVFPRSLKLRSVLGPYEGVVIDAAGATEGVLIDKARGAGSSSLLEGFEIKNAINGCVSMVNVSATLRALNVHHCGKGIRLIGSSTAFIAPTVDNVEVSFTEASSGYGIGLQYASGSVRHARVHDNPRIGMVTAYGGAPSFENLLLERNGYGIYFWVSTPTIAQATILDSTWYGVTFSYPVAEQVPPYLVNSIIEGSGECELYESPCGDGTLPVGGYNYLLLSADSGGCTAACGEEHASAFTTLQMPETVMTTTDAGLSSDAHLALDSEAIHAGLPEYEDPDGSVTDLGAFGGAAASGWNLDGDARFWYWWPGTFESPPSGIEPADYEEEDRH